MTDESLLLIRFLKDNDLDFIQLKKLRAWMLAPEHRDAVDKFMLEVWEKSQPRESKLTFDQLLEVVNGQYQQERSVAFGKKRGIELFQRVAAMLIIPLALFFIYYAVSQKSGILGYAETIVPKGQKSEVVLPDSTHIWLNSGSQLRYPVKFSDNRREVFLQGEAYFEVEKNWHKPFLVHASSLTVKVTGTKFNVMAYPDDSDITTALLEGHVNLSVKPENGKTKRIEMQPGDLVEYSKKQNSLLMTNFKKDEVVGWKNNQLVFRDDTFDKLVKKIERWYNVQVVYDKIQFNDRRLTVELLEGESLDRLCQIIEKTMNVTCTIEKQKVYIEPKL